MSVNPSLRKKTLRKKLFREFLLSFIALMIIVLALGISWVANLELPDFNNFENRAVANSTKIYDRTGKIVLYSIYDNIKRTQVPITEVSPYIKQATVSIEDSSFYEHHGFKITSFIRAMLANLQSGGFSQGGSTITQQVVKNALLTRDKTISRKLKEIVLSLKLDRQVPKDMILQIYLNESPYGGTIYGVEEASMTYFGKPSKDVTLTEAAYLAALPQSPTYYSPFGKHQDALEKRKNLVLERMYELGYITEAEKNTSQAETIKFEKSGENTGKALHFDMYIREYLEQKYGTDMVQNGGLKVISTIDYELQKKMEAVVKEGALLNAKTVNASNAALVAIDPKTGEILSMVGSRDFFDTEIQGQYNIATALRQPGSSFKPFVYAAALNLGYTPETILFDVPTQFSTACDAYGNPLAGSKASSCYMPNNFDDAFRGPVSLRSALAQSLNIPSVKLLYLVGLNKAISLAQDMGLSTITDPSRYGLSLVLGGGEVTLLELTNAYGVFANNGVYSKPQGILEIRDRDNNLLEKFTPEQKQVLPEPVTSDISSMLSDFEARHTTNQAFKFGDRPVALKTGTTNDYRDVWVVGYTPSLVIGMWAGNNDNTPIAKKVSGLVLVPIWHKALVEAMGTSSIEYFPEPLPNTSTKPILRGDYCAPDGIHTILQYVKKSDPEGPAPENPASDPQYSLWETGLQNWLAANPLSCGMSNTQENTTQTNVVIATTTVQ